MAGMPLNKRTTCAIKNWLDQKAATTKLFYNQLKLIIKFGLKFFQVMIYNPQNSMLKPHITHRTLEFWHAVYTSSTT